MALKLYGRANRWTRSFLVESALRLGLPERATHRILDDVCSGVREAIGDVGAIGFDEKATRRLAKFLETRCEDLS